MSAKSEDSIETKDSGLGDKPTEEFEPRTNTGRKLKEREYLGKDKFNIPGEVLESFIEDLVGDERFRISKCGERKLPRFLIANYSCVSLKF